MKLPDLSSVISQTHIALQSNAIKAINRNLTLRNGLIGFYIVEFEQKGEDRAQYGTNLLKTLEKQVNTRGLTETLFKLSRQFYITYPQIIISCDTVAQIATPFSSFSDLSDIVGRIAKCW